MTPEAWRQRAEGRELCDCGRFDEDHGDKCRRSEQPLERCLWDGVHPEGDIIRQVLCPDGGEFRRARRPE